MNEATQDLIRELESKRMDAERSQRSAARSSDKELADYQRDYCAALETALRALEEKQ